MTVRVEGYEDGVAYTVEIDPEATVRPADRGIVGIITHASPLGVLVHVIEHVGEPVSVTHTGPEVTVNVNDATSIIAALQTYTEVRAVTGEPSEDWPASEGDVVYGRHP